MTIAEEICGGLDFLIKEAKEIGAYIETGAEHDVFYAGLHYGVAKVTCEHNDRISIRMKKLGWTQVEDGCPLGFTHSIG